MKAGLLVLTMALLPAVTASPSKGSEEWAFESWQPIFTPNSIWVSPVTVVTFNSGDVGVSAVLATCDSNLVATDYGPNQRNVAFVEGLRVEVTFNSGREPPLFGDTLRVTLRGTETSGALEDFSFATIVAATVECIKTNAALSPAIKFVALRLEDKALNKRFGGVFKTDPFRHGPRKREFTDTNLGK